MLISFFPQKDQHVKNEHDVDEYLKIKFISYISINRKQLRKSMNLDGRIWPYSEKDKM